MVLETIIFYSLGAAIVTLGGGITAGLASELQSREEIRRLVKLSRQRRSGSPPKPRRQASSPDTVLLTDFVGDDEVRLSQRYGLVRVKARSFDSTPSLTCGDIALAHDRRSRDDE